MRLGLLSMAIVGFAGLGLYDVATGNVGVGIAGLLLAGANAILLTA